MTTFRILACLLLLVALGRAQAPDSAGSQKILEELKGVRAELARVTGLLEKSQRAQLLLGRLQVEASRMAVLEAEQVRLSAQEPGLEKEASSTAAVVRAEETGALPTLPGAVSPSRNLAAQARGKLEDSRRARQNAEQEIARLKNQIASIEKSLEEITR